MIRFFAGHPTASNLLVLAFVALGLIALPDIKRETLPDIAPTEIEIRIPYPGATAEEVENGVCRRIEDAVEGIENREETRCEAREGLAIGTVVMVEDADFDRFLNDIKTEIEAIDNFPDEIETPIIKQLGLFDFVASIAVTGPMSTPDLKAYAEDMKDRILRLDDITQVTIKGFPEHQIRVELHAETLRRFGLSVQSVADIVASQSVDLPAGTVETRDSELLLRFADERRTPRSLADIVVVSAASGAEVQLGDIADISHVFDPETERIDFNGQRAALLTVDKTKADDTLDVMDAIQGFLDKERLRAPPNMRFAITQNVSSIVRDRLDMLLTNGLQGLALVFLTMWLVFSFRFSFWVAAALPVSFLGALFGMSVLDYSLDMLTMVGLLIAVGLLVDDAIVIAENIAAHVARGKPYLEAAVDGINEVKAGVIASFLTTVCVFGALAFLKGQIGMVLRVMPVVLILTLAVSIVEAFLILPHHLAHAVSGGAMDKPKGFRRHVEGAVAWTRDKLVGRLVDRAIEWRYLTLGIAIALLLASIAMPAGGILKFVPFPDLDGDVATVRLLMPQGTPAARTEAVIARITDSLAELNREFTPSQPDGQPLVQNVSVQYGVNTDAYESGPHVATVTADLLAAETRTTMLDTLRNRWREAVGDVPDVIGLTFTGFAVPLSGRPIDIRLMGPDLHRLKAAARELQTWLGAYQGVNDLADDLRPGKPEIRLRLREGASALGLDARAIAAQIRAAFHGSTADEIQDGPESIEIDVRLHPDDRQSLADLDNLVILAPDGAQVPLSAAAAVEHARGWARINRVDGRRTVTIQGDVDTDIANAREILATTQAEFIPGLLQRYPEVSVGLEGQAKETAKTGNSLRKGAIMGVLGVFILLSFLFRSYVEPIAVLAAIPLTLVGVVWGHMAMGIDLAMPSMMGLASLAGVIVNNSILLMEFIRIGRRGGLNAADAARYASRARFRPILLTSATTIMGLLPMLLERSLQAQILIPLVASLAFGLFAGTVLALFVVPAFYVILDDVHLARTPDNS